MLSHHVGSWHNFNNIFTDHFITFLLDYPFEDEIFHFVLSQFKKIKSSFFITEKIKIDPLSYIVAENV